MSYPIVSPKQVGILGEKFARDYLVGNGFKVLDTNYKSRIKRGPLKGEIDIVAKKGGIIHFIEVKTLRHFVPQGKHYPKRREGPFHQDRPFSPEDRVNFEKRNRIARTAEVYLADKKISFETPWQIDVLAIAVVQSGEVKIEYFENISTC